MTLKAILALLQAAILAAGITLLGALVAESLERSLRQEVDNLLEARAATIEVQVRSRIERGAAVDPGADVNLDPHASEAFADLGILVEVWDEDGRRVAASRGLGERDIPWTDAARAAVGGGESLLETAPVPGNDRLRVLTRPIQADGRMIGIIRVVEPLHLIDTVVTSLLRLLVVGGGLILVVCIIATWLVVSRALEPLETVARTAERIAETGDVSAGVEPAGSGELIRLSESFNRMVERVRRLLETQRQLLADTSHELRNPLTVIRTDLDLLGRNLDAETRQEVAGEAAEEAERMSRLVTDLLFLAREDVAAPAPGELVRLDLLAADVVDRLAHLAADHQVALVKSEPLEVVGDADRLRQLLANLVENAIRYTPAGGQIAVAVSSIEAGNGRLQARLDVTDDGVGIAPEHLDRVFDRFYRVDPARGRGSGGTGLGLAIVKRIADTHGGSVQAASTPGVGSTFTVLLPTPSFGLLPRSVTSAGPDTPPDRQAASAAAPSARAGGSQPDGTPAMPDHPGRRP